MNLTKDQISKIISIVIMAAIALLVVFDYDVAFVQPQLRAMRGGQPQTVGSQAVLGPYFENLNIGKNLKSFGTTEMVTATVTKLTATTIVSQAIGFDTTGNGTVAAPAYTFASDLDSGVYRIGANNLGVGVAGAKVLDVSATGLGVVGVAKSGDGTVNLPSYSFTSDPDSGAYVIGANNLGVAVNATKILDVGTTGLGVVGVIKTGDGTVSLPGLAFTSDPDTGLYSIAGNDIGIATNGVKALDVSATAVNLALPAVHAVGSAAAPAVTFASDTNTGIYRVGSDDVGIATNGVLAMNVSASAVTFALPTVFTTQSYTPTSALVFTPTAELVTLTPGEAVGLALGACTTGSKIMFYNGIAFNVVITDAGNFQGAGNQTLGQYDTMPAACFGSVWVQTGPVSAN